VYIYEHYINRYSFNYVLKEGEGNFRGSLLLSFNLVWYRIVEIGKMDYRSINK
jgi:hypothetical protein